MQSRFWSKSPDCFRFAEAFPKYNKRKLNIFPVARGITWYQQKFSNRHRKPRPNRFQTGGQDTMLVLVLCSFGMAADKYFFKLNQHHSLPSPGDECLALTQTQGMAVIPTTGEVFICL